MPGIYEYVRHEKMTAEEVLQSFPSEERWIEIYREHNVKALPIAATWEDKELHATPDNELAKLWMHEHNNYIAGLIKKYPDVCIQGWGSVDIFRGQLAVDEAVRCVKELGFLGIKQHQAAEAFFPNDKRFYPIWEALQSVGGMAMFHTGYTGVGGFMRGGCGISPITYTNPLYLDDICRDFPDLKVVGSHPSWPYESIAIGVWLHKPNYYRELSGWVPKYWEEELRREVNTRLQDKVMFGTEGPSAAFERAFPGIIASYRTSEFRPGVREKIMYQNAERILGLKL